MKTMRQIHRVTSDNFSEHIPYEWDGGMIRLRGSMPVTLFYIPDPDDESMSAIVIEVSDLFIYDRDHGCSNGMRTTAMATATELSDYIEGDFLEVLAGMSEPEIIRTLVEAGRRLE